VNEISVQYEYEYGYRTAISGVDVSITNRKESQQIKTKG